MCVLLDSIIRENQTWQHPPRTRLGNDTLKAGTLLSDLLLEIELTHGWLYEHIVFLQHANICNTVFIGEKKHIAVLPEVFCIIFLWLVSKTCRRKRIEICYYMNLIIVRKVFAWASVDQDTLTHYCAAIMRPNAWFRMTILHYIFQMKSWSRCRWTMNDAVRPWTHKGHSIPRPHGRAMECIYGHFENKMVALYNGLTV